MVGIHNGWDDTHCENYEKNPWIFGDPENSLDVKMLVVKIGASETSCVSFVKIDIKCRNEEITKHLLVGIKKDPYHESMIDLWILYPRQCNL